MKILILGSKGQLGKIINNKLLKKKNFIVKSLSRKNFDLTNNIKLTKYINQINPDVIINCVAYTDVENAEINKKKCFLINSKFTSVLSDLCFKNNYFLIHFSTDFVFNGKKSIPYRPDSETNPINIYGESKALGEENIQKVFELSDNYIILRTSWVISPVGRNFLLTMLKLHQDRDSIKVVSDQIGCPSSTVEIANACWEIINNIEAKSYLPRIIHWRNNGVASWYDLAHAIGEIAHEIGIINSSAKVIPISSNEFPTAAKRPSFSLLDISESVDLLCIQPEHWRSSVRKILLNLKQFDNVS